MWSSAVLKIFELDNVMKFVNLTPHVIAINDGRTFPSVGLARVQATFGDFDNDGVTSQLFGAVEGLPEPEEGTSYIVSGLVLTAMAASARKDLVAPASGHPEVVRNEKGHIVSVPGFIR